METQTPDTPTTTQDNGPGNSLAERLASAVNPIKRGRGRPPGSKSKTTEVSRVAIMANPAGSRSQLSREDQAKNCAFFVDCAVLVFEGTDEFLKKILTARLRSYVKDEVKIREFEATILKESFTEKDRENLRHLLTELAIKYPILQKIGPEIGLLVFLCKYGMKQAQIARSIELWRPVTTQPIAPKPA